MAQYIPWASANDEERFERVRQGIRVLQSMPKHVRNKHFDMGEWGIKTKCGTVACAAGHMGLDKWFRKRGLWMSAYKNAVTRWPRLSVRDFFGNTLTEAVFLSTEPRSVDQVIAELQAYLVAMSLHGTSANYDADAARCAGRRLLGDLAA